MEDRGGRPDPDRNHPTKVKRPHTRHYRGPVVAFAIDPRCPPKEYSIGYHRLLIFFFYFFSVLTVTTNFEGTTTNNEQRTMGCIAASTTE